MSKVNFNVNAYTARLIGRENVSKLSGAVLELVKNTYDADSRFCILYFDSLSRILYIIDNGSGMDENTIVNHWMTIGNSPKKINYKSRQGRIQTGAKGIGRFALDRIADVCEMLTITDKSALLWNVDWRNFTEEKNITEVSAEINECSLSIKDFLSNISNIEFQKFIIEHNFDTGTVFKISNLRDDWDMDTIVSLKEVLKTLIPSEFKSVFDIYFFVDQCSIVEAEIIKDDGEFPFDYKIEFKVDENCNARISILRNEFDFGHRSDEILSLPKFSVEDKNYFYGEPIVYIRNLSELSTRDNEIINKIGKFSGVLYFSKQQTTASDKEKYFYKDITSNIISKNVFKGIKLYRDNFRVRPYGEPNSSNFDWLQLSSRRTASPAAISHPTGKWRVSEAQLAGSIYISRLNTSLPDQSNREGIVETKEFLAFKEIIINIISLFEDDRQKIGRILSEYYDYCNKVSELEKKIKQKAEEEKKNKRKKKETNDDNQTHIPASEAQKVIDKKDDMISVLEDENRLLRVLATTGIVTNTYIHEFKELTHKLKLQISLAYDALEIDESFEKALEHLKKADELKDTFNSWFQVTINMVKKDKRKYRKIDLVKLIHDVKKSWETVLEPMMIDLTIQNNSKEKLYIKGFTFELEAIFNNLISNSKIALDSLNYSKEIKVEIAADNENIYIKYNDNGKGLSDFFKKNPYKILEPFETDKTNENGEKIGTGMGMWIINKTVNEYHGKINLDDNISHEKGFYITIILPKEKDE